MRADAEAIWRAGVAAVDSETLVKGVVHCDDGRLTVCGHDIPLRDVRRIVVVGAGKAGAGMALGFEGALAPRVLANQVVGWLNVPADCVRPLEKIQLHAARPAGVNEPTEAGVAGSERILKLAAEAGPNDVLIVLLSGGGSALLPAPLAGISLADKQAVTRLLMRSGATIGELNCVRKQLSRIKGGRLAQATSAKIVIALIISDVVGDPLDVIASGPTTADPSAPAEALQILRRYARSSDDVPPAVIAALEKVSTPSRDSSSLRPNVHNHVIGNNDVALRAAEREARSRGYQVHSLGSNNQGEASEVGRELAHVCVTVRDQGKPELPPLCIVSGGEPVVHLAKTDAPRKGGRNQQLVLAGLCELWDDEMNRIVLLSGGTDGEDGPTDAAGAVADSNVIADARRAKLQPERYLAINDAYHFFEQCGGLLKTGPTHTNVMDLRVALIGASTQAAPSTGGA